MRIGLADPTIEFGAARPQPKARPGIYMVDSTQSVALDDRELAAQAKQGDRSAFTELVNRYARNIFRLARPIRKA